MAKIVFISCVKSKCSHPTRAEALYLGALFTKALRYARSLSPDHIYILSAEHGVLELDAIVAPYEKTLITMRLFERRAWAEKVIAQLRSKVDLQNDEFVFLAGKHYRDGLTAHLVHYSVPMEGLRIGEQLGWLAERVG